MMSLICFEHHINNKDVEITLKLKVKLSYATCNLHSLHGQCRHFHCLVATLNFVIICIPLNSNGTVSQIFGCEYEKIFVPGDKPLKRETVNLS